MTISTETSGRAAPATTTESRKTGSRKIENRTGEKRTSEGRAVGSGAEESGAETGGTAELIHIFGKAAPPRATADAAPIAPIATRMLSYRVLRTHLALNAQATDILASTAGVTLSQWRVMSFVGSGDATTARGIANASGLFPAVISRAMKALEERGLLATERLQEDRRTLSLRLTDKGQEIYDRTRPLMLARQDALFDALSPEERGMIIGALEKLEMAADQRDFAV